ncbi:MAG: HicB family protein, partial [Lachnospiraceae bacterium]|nr:HicB family protein [Lachnospiraceae bacterium]
ISEKRGEEIPFPSKPENISLEKIAMELECSVEGAFINMISVDVASYAKEHFEKSVKKTLSIPMWLNQAALEENINFSQVLQEALITKLKRTS